MLYQGFEIKELYTGCMVEVRLPSKLLKSRQKEEEALEPTPSKRIIEVTPTFARAHSARVAPAASHDSSDSFKTSTSAEENSEEEEVNKEKLDPDGKPKNRRTVSNAKHLVRGYRERIWEFMDDPISSTGAMVMTIFIMALILLSTVTFVIETLPQFYKPNQPLDSYWYLSEAICISVFTIEVIIRVAVCPSISNYFRDTMNVIDIIAILPFYVESILSGLEVPGLAVFRVIRLVRIFRLFKVSRGSITIFARTMSVSARPLYMLIFFTLLAMVIFSSLMYYSERGEYDDNLGVWLRLKYWECPVVLKVRDGTSQSAFIEEVEDGGMHVCASLFQVACRFGGNHTADGSEKLFYVPYNFRPFDLESRHGKCVGMYEQSPFESIPASFWWTLVTMTTVGYGDITPTYWYGKVVGCCVMFFGILVIALPITVIGSNFAHVYKTLTEQQAKERGGRVDDSDDEDEKADGEEDEDEDAFDPDEEFPVEPVTPTTKEAIAALAQ